MLDLSREDSARLEEVVERFEKAWLSGQRPVIDAYLTGDDPCRLHLLVELVHADLECRLKSGDGVRVEHYLERYAELAGTGDLAVDLIWAEYQLRRAEPGLSLDDYLCRFPQYAADLERRRTGQPDARSTVDNDPPTPQTTPRLDPADRWARLFRSAQAPATPARYRTLQFHARGGLGEVLKAHDEELQREVALKRIQSRFAGDENSRRRFLREAQLTARLEHPGIVPVYGLVEDDEGQPCYAMRFIEGESLQDALKRFHEADQKPGRDPAERNLMLRELLSRFSAVCKTVAFAHSRGIIHRDLKPANIMLGAYGETLVVDWGLARSSEREAPEPSLPGSGSPLASGTQQGQVLGTPAFMSPEQAGGRWDEVGPASDIYSLGATLFTLLTGQAPFTGSKPADIVGQVQKGLGLHPRQVKPDVPRGLEAICVKAMALAPADRYATGLTLAADLEHWLADEPVAAYPEPWSMRTRRWLGRHRALVMSAAASLLVGAMTLSVLAAVLTAKNQDLQQAKAEADRQRDQARSDFRLARQTVNEYCIAVSDNLRLRAEDLRPLRTQLLQRAVRFHEKFKEHHGDDPEVQRDRAQAYFQLGTLTRQIARPEDALRYFRQALDQYEVLVRTGPGTPIDRGEQARSLRMLGSLHHELGQNRAAEKAYQQALAIQEVLAASAGAGPAYQVDLAQTYGLLGILYKDLGRFDAAEAAYGKARDLMKALADAHQDVPDYRAEMALHLNNLGVLYHDTHRPHLARDIYRQALAVYQQLANTYPMVLEYQKGLAQSNNDLATWYRDRGDRDKAVEFLRRAYLIHHQLADRHASVTEYQADLADRLTNLGVVYSELRRFALAEPLLRQAQTIRLRLVELYPGVTNYQVQLAGILNNLGALYLDQQRWSQTAEAYHQARGLQHRLVVAHPDIPEYVRDLGCSFHNMGALALAQRRHIVALAWFTQAVYTLESLRPKQRDTTADRFLALANGGRSRMLTRSFFDKPADAMAHWDQLLVHCPEPDRAFCRLQRALCQVRAGDHARAVAEAELVAKKRPLPPERHYDLACLYSQAARAVLRDARLPSLERKSRADRHAAEAVAWLRRARTAGYFQVADRLTRMKRDQDLVPLRSHAGYKELLKELMP